MTIQPERFRPTWTLGDRIRKARLSTGRNQRDFAPLIGVKAGSLAAWESDHSAPRNIIAVAKRIEALTGIPAGWVLGLDDGPPSGPPGGGDALPKPWGDQPTDLPNRMVGLNTAA
jgi:transcriptional regulator with XRE-family HTH domain